jgi:hypothetical protein
MEWILRREFPGAFATLHSSDADAILGAEHLRDCLLNNPHIKAVTSHHLRYPMGEIPGTVLFDCCFLRHPLDRLQSLYDHFRRTGEEDWVSRLARRESSQGFMKTLVETAPHVVSNVQTLYLSMGGALTRPAGPWDLEKAFDILRQMSFPGLVERFDQSLVAAEYFLRPAFPELRLEYVAQNVGLAKEAERSGERGGRLMALWGEELHAQLVHLNEYDLKLFKLAADEIERRTSLIPCFPRLLDEFRQRCAALRPQQFVDFPLNRAPAAART